jgi:hypothetical protein
VPSTGSHLSWQRPLERRPGGHLPGLRAAAPCAPAMGKPRLRHLTAPNPSQARAWRPSLATEPGDRAWRPSLAPELGARAWRPGLARAWRPSQARACRAAGHHRRSPSCRVPLALSADSAPSCRAPVLTQLELPGAFGALRGLTRSSSDMQCQWPGAVVSACQSALPVPEVATVAGLGGAAGRSLGLR